MDPARIAGPSPMGAHWALDDTLDFLNHGSFGACPTAILDAQQRWRQQLERSPVHFMEDLLEPAADAATQSLAAFVGADPDDVAWVDNATSGVNTVLRSLVFQPGDELLTTDHAYNACRNALDAVAERSGAKVVVAPIPFPLDGPDTACAALLAAATGRTKLVLLDQITSPTGLVLPAAELVAAFAARGIDTLVDGAHAPGMVQLDLDAMGAAYFTGNCHKWLCTPKGCAFLHVRRDRQHLIRPLTISHGANSPRTDRSRFRLEFDWTGTRDPSPWLVLPEAFEFLAGLLDGGDPSTKLRGLREHNHTLVISARKLLLDALGQPEPCPQSMLGSLASVPLFTEAGEPLTRDRIAPQTLHQDLRDRFRIEVPVMPHPGLGPAQGQLLIRVSAQAHNCVEQYSRLAEALPLALRGV